MIEEAKEMFAGLLSLSWLPVSSHIHNPGKKSYKTHQLSGLYLAAFIHTSRKMSVDCNFLSGNSKDFPNLAVTCGSLIPQSMS